MTPHDLPLDLDVSRCGTNYGVSMQTSSLADWVELQTLRGMHRPWRSLATMMREAGIAANLIDETYANCEAIEEELGTNATIDTADIYDELLPEGLSETVRRIIDYRMRYLGESYPFKFDTLDVLTIVDDFPVGSSSYLDLLRLSSYMGWIYNLPNGSSLKDTATHLFEEIVAIALQGTGLSSSIMGTSQSGSFEERLRKCGDDLDLVVSVGSVSHSKNQQDDGVDIIGGKLWRDHRLGEPVWLIQATCGKNRRNKWKQKLLEPDPGKWKQYLSTRSEPASFLAVPYHMTVDAIDSVIPYSGSYSFIDRLRIVKMIGQSITYENDDTKTRCDAIRAKTSKLLGIPISTEISSFRDDC